MCPEQVEWLHQPSVAAFMCFELPLASGADENAACECSTQVEPVVSAESRRSRQLLSQRITMTANGVFARTCTHTGQGGSV